MSHLEIITTSEAARYCSLPERKLLKMAETFGLAPYRRIGCSLIWNYEVLDELLKKLKERNAKPRRRRSKHEISQTQEDK